ncbi:MAG: TIGR04348 family glycosyltransferase [Rhodospirillaceae bacterium]|nr:TIGR04348 family glycosyltransferase [Rhodospirillaceae bacterium]
MNIILITPAARLAKNGNRTTAVRWARILRDLGHRVRVDVDWDGKPADLMVAIHAWRSAEAALRFRERYPDRPLIVLLSGTDIYRFQESHPEVTRQSMEIADALACLHGQVHRSIPKEFASKVHVVHQSAPPLPQPRRPSQRHLDICVIGHLREEKDPLRTAYAVRDLPADSNIRVIHLGKAHTPDWAEKAEAEMARNDRYHWLGEVPGWRVRREFVKTHAMVLSSVMEGGANVISEAVAAGVPVLASDIEGSVGLLGEDYGGYYPVKNTGALQRLLLRAENEPGFLVGLGKQGAAKRHLFTPERETAEWKSLLEVVGA